MKSDLSIKLKDEEIDIARLHAIVRLTEAARSTERTRELAWIIRLRQ